ncbi:hypothetical protein [Streptosporangium roseum]|uniref:hypothetical protein n=1 Tax=Streptosporangium roseum TaxID=2001 RepID=UPI00331FC570
MHAVDLIKAYETADEATNLATEVADAYRGNPDVFPTIACAIGIARDAYTKWADAMGRDSVAAELLHLGQVARAWIDTLVDGSVRMIAIRVGFPAALIHHVSADALRFWINPAYPADHDRKQHIAHLAGERFARDYGAAALAAALAEDTPVLVRLPDGVRPTTTFLALLGL